MSNKKNLVHLGPNGSYTQIAAEHIAKDSLYKDVKFVTNNSIINVINVVDSNDDYIAVVPIENSIEGIVRETIDNLIKVKSELYITKEVVIPISHCLISKNKNISAITKITSMPQALAQCQNYIAENLPDVEEQIPTTSTSYAVQQLETLPVCYAAIASVKAAEIYNLNILAKNINDEHDNKTRFICLDRVITESTGNDKTSVAFSTVNEAGSLVEVLNCFRLNGINLSYIESRPSKKVFGEYIFFIDFDGHINDENVKRTLSQIKPHVRIYKFLGSYPKFKMG